MLDLSSVSTQVCYHQLSGNEIRWAQSDASMVTVSIPHYFPTSSCRIYRTVNVGINIFLHFSSIFSTQYYLVFITHQAYIVTLFKVKIPSCRISWLFLIFHWKVAQQVFVMINWWRWLWGVANFSVCVCRLHGRYNMKATVKWCESNETVLGLQDTPVGWEYVDESYSKKVLDTLRWWWW